MRCNKCNVEIACQSKTCPLCHQPLDCEGEVAFPTPSAKKILWGKLSIGYAITAFVVSVISIAVNLVFTPKLLWCIPVIIGLIYFYYFINITVDAKRGFHKRILGQAIILTIVFVVLKKAFKVDHWFFDIYLPTVYIVSDILIIIFIFKRRQELSKYIATLLLICLFGSTPCIGAYIFNLPLKLPSIIVTGINALFFIVAIIVCRKNIGAEIKKIFHL